MKKLLFSAALLSFLSVSAFQANACDGKKCGKECKTECKTAAKDEKCAEKCASKGKDAKDEHCADKKDGKKGGCCAKDKAPAKS